MKKFLYNQKGFTLIEVIIVILITGILSTTLMNLIAAGRNMYQRNTDIDEIENDARIGMAAIVSRIRKNDKVDDSLNHQVQIVDSSNNILADYGDKSSILRIDSSTWLTIEGGQIVEKSGSDTKELTKTGLIKSLEFTNISDGENFSIRIKIKYDQSEREKKLENDIVLRSGR